MRELRSHRKNSQLSSTKNPGKENRPPKNQSPNQKNRESRRNTRLNPKPPTPPPSPTTTRPKTPPPTPAPKKKTPSDLEQFYMNLDNPLAMFFI